MFCYFCSPSSEFFLGKVHFYVSKKNLSSEFKSLSDSPEVLFQENDKYPPHWLANNQ